MDFPRLLVAVAALGAASTAWGQQSCESLASLKLPSITITSAVSVAAGPFTVPGGRGNNTVQMLDQVEIEARKSHNRTGPSFSCARRLPKMAFGNET